MGLLGHSVGTRLASPLDLSQTKDYSARLIVCLWYFINITPIVYPLARSTDFLLEYFLHHIIIIRSFLQYLSQAFPLNNHLTRRRNFSPFTEKVYRALSRTRARVINSLNTFSI